MNNNTKKRSLALSLLSVFVLGFAAMTVNDLEARGRSHSGGGMRGSGHGGPGGGVHVRGGGTMQHRVGGGGHGGLRHGGRHGGRWHHGGWGRGWGRGWWGPSYWGGYPYYRSSYYYDCPYGYYIDSYGNRVCLDSEGDYSVVG